MKIGIIGGGFAGLTAAYDLLKAGHQVTVFEAAPQVGGLASGFKAPGWDWSLERFYHHIFTTDADIIALAKAIGAEDLLFFNQQNTAFFCPEHGAHAVTTLGILRYPHLPFLDRIRFGVSGLQLKLRNDWQRLERITAEQHMTRWAGKRAYQELWQPLFDGKFGPYASQVNAAWIWARGKSRSFKLGYFKGGFQAFADALAAYVSKIGGSLKLNAPVQRLEQIDGGWRVFTNGVEDQFDRVIVASAPGVLMKLAPELPAEYTDKLKLLKSIGAVVMVATLKQPLLTNGVYWLNITKGALPFLALVEHTNMIPARHYGGDRVIYCGDYLPTDHRYFTMSDEDVTNEWLASLKTANPNFDPSWVKQTWLFREAYAQPIVPLNHSRNLPSLRTPLDGLFFASMNHVYPWDRGTNFAVELGHRVAREVASSGVTA
ncbi:MAG: NAD(P)/FAD-dependent oxidoreductase [Chloroflexi bacterium]|nr:NAD(P)/FAD-dependent oxidoreductase [Chloroflexota bacterium]